MTTTPDITITAARIDADQFLLETTERVDLVNRAQATYSRRWYDWEAGVNSAEQATVRDADPSGIARYGILYSDTIVFPYIGGEAQAQDVVSWMVLDRAETRYVARFAGGQWLQRVEVGDVINLDPSGSAELTRALLGLITSADNFRVLQVNRGEDGRIQVTAVQIRTPAYLLKEDGEQLTLEDEGGIIL